MDTSGRTPKFYPAEQMQQVGVVPIGGMQSEQPPMEEEGTDNILSRLASLLAPLSNALDLPGSMVRDVATIRNPLDQLMSPFSSENRTSGRQMLRDYGAVGEEDTYLNAILGGLTEIGTNPLSFMGTGVPQALGKAALTGATKLGTAAVVPKALQGVGKQASGLASQAATSAAGYAKPIANYAGQKASNAINAMKTPGPMPQGTGPSMMNSVADFAGDLQSRLRSMTPQQRESLLSRYLAMGSAGAAMTRGEPSGQ